MFDITLRPLKDGLFDPCCKYIPAFVTPSQVTGLAFVFGLLSCYSISVTHDNNKLALVFWAFNRSLDCLDGALARHRGTASDLGGFLDLLGDFIIYSVLPIAIAQGFEAAGSHVWIAVAVLEATFHVNNFILFYVAAIAEKLSKVEEKGDASKGKTKELTSVMMRPALMEGMESGLMFTAMLVYPSEVQALSWTMAGLVAVGILQRTLWVVKALG
ncbi:MAG: hypothetical protein LQ348_004437 [Seirophora lacunosa]|nr:MAG: hypothetical protein LQ344_007953 [Seirophora lacunosa]KAI4185020.1 MAG: hypothetical protein LQ348_004437 [Seirophora lacunosa]